MELTRLLDGHTSMAVAISVKVMNGNAWDWATSSKINDVISDNKGGSSVFPADFLEKPGCFFITLNFNVTKGCFVSWQMD